MISSIAILVFSTALFLFYVQTLCENVLRREFRRAYSRDVLNAIDLEFPRLRQAVDANVEVSPAQIRVGLKADYSTLTFLVKNGNPKQRHFSWKERMLKGYFRLLLVILPARYAFHLQERGAVIKLTTILHHFANLAGERVFSAEAPAIAQSRQG